MNEGEDDDDAAGSTTEDTTGKDTSGSTSTSAAAAVSATTTATATYRTISDQSKKKSTTDGWDEVKRERNRVNSQKTRQREKMLVETLEGERGRLWLSNDALKYQNAHLRDAIRTIASLRATTGTRRLDGRQQTSDAKIAASMAPNVGVSSGPPAPPPHSTVPPGNLGSLLVPTGPVQGHQGPGPLGIGFGGQTAAGPPQVDLQLLQSVMSGLIGQQQQQQQLLSANLLSSSPFVSMAAAATAREAELSALRRQEASELQAGSRPPDSFYPQHLQLQQVGQQLHPPQLQQQQQHGNLDSSWMGGGGGGGGGGSGDGNSGIPVHVQAGLQARDNFLRQSRGIGASSLIHGQQGLGGSIGRGVSMAGDYTGLGLSTDSVTGPATATFRSTATLLRQQQTAEGASIGTEQPSTEWREKDQYAAAATAASSHSQSTQKPKAKKRKHKR